MIGPAEIIARLLIGAVIGGIIGFERHAHGRAAGIRTHLLVCVACVLVMIVSEYAHYTSLLNPLYLRVDPARIAAGAITGVGFLGAGVIIKSGINIQGLTTAACLWTVSVIGLSIGSGLYLPGIATFAIIYMALWLLRDIERRMPGLYYRYVTIFFQGDGNEAEVSAILAKYRARITNTNYERDTGRRESLLDYTIALQDNSSVKNILDDLSAISNVTKVTIKS